MIGSSKQFQTNLVGTRGIVSNIQLSNNGLHQTGRGGAVASRPVVEARPAGEAKCSTDLALRDQWCQE